MTRAADISTDNLTSFVVNAKQAGGSTSYFDNGVFNKSGSVFVSESKYYWPASGSLDFYAYSPSGNSQVNYSGYKTFTVTPSTTIADQVDFVFAATMNKSKEDYGASGVPLNFRHTGAKIACYVKNSSTTLKFDVYGWKVGYICPAATFTFSDANTDGNNDGSGTTLTPEQWGNRTDASIGTEYESTFSVKLKIRNNDSAGTIIADDGADGAFWAIWPIGGYSWEPGKKYTYTIDLAGGGYYETNQADTDGNLDAILEGAEIKFATVTVDGWTDRAVNIPPPTNLTELRTLATGGGDCSEYIGWVITSDGCIYPNATAAGEKTKVAMIAYAGLAGSADTSTGSESYCGLAIALTDADNTNSSYFGPSETDESLTNYQSTDAAGAMTDKAGVANTAALLSAHPEGTTYFAYKANNYSVVRPSNTSAWFVPSFGQWILFLNSFGADLTSSNIGTKRYSPLDSEVRSRISMALTNAGGNIIKSEGYGSSTECSSNDFWNASFNTSGNSTNFVAKNSQRNVRTFFAF